MVIEVALLISGASLAWAVYQGGSNLKRNKTSDDKKEATEMTAVMVKLEMINDGIREIKGEIGSLKSEMQEVRERLIIVEQSAKSAHHRMDTFEGKEE